MKLNAEPVVDDYLPPPRLSVAPRLAAVKPHGIVLVLAVWRALRQGWDYLLRVSRHAYGTGIGKVAVTTSEYRVAERLKDDYWPYVVFACASTSKLHAIRNPAKLGWQPVVNVEHYRVPSDAIREAAHE